MYIFTVKIIDNYGMYDISNVKINRINKIYINIRSQEKIMIFKDNF